MKEESIHGRADGQDREAEESPVADVAKKHAISEQTLSGWRRTFAGMSVPDAKRVKALEAEPQRLKQPLAERDLDIEVLSPQESGDRIRTAAGGSDSRMSASFDETVLRKTSGEQKPSPTRPRPGVPR